MGPVFANSGSTGELCQVRDWVNASIVADLHESGIAAPSTTLIRGDLAIRAAIVNHRTTFRDVDALVDATLRLGARRTASA